MPAVPEPVQTPAVVVEQPATQPGQELWNQQPIGTYTVALQYIPSLSDELEVQPGDQVQVFVEYDDGWCLGANLTRGSQNQRGVFPKQCVEQTFMAPPAPQNKRVSSLYMGVHTPF
ncbi:hypothetical protein BCR43DRAFT_435320 [Syncephalastrum racemosum]|uniref:SH3 domain-containing protein n=1 Tax=Syncephalastrum racemosum TaxID=13706 RepID=A0A1X2HKY4_SYNRA|nr:hypothetical protein BCR43DRAFT_435320 [Syncephalastrum racemosum]